MVICVQNSFVLFLYEFWTHFLSDLKISLITMRYLEWPKSLQKKRSKRHSLKNQSRYFLCKFHVIPNNFQGTCNFIWLIIFNSLMWYQLYIVCMFREIFTHFISISTLFRILGKLETISTCIFFVKIPCLGKFKTE